ncbi:MAG: hypothetical protein ABIP36_01950 [Acidimicrobiales bacterium]
MSDIGGEVRLGSMLFTLVEPHPGHEVAYNRWYERDHFYAGCMVGPWLFAGRRYVATRALKDLRFGAESELFGGMDLGSYLAIYWILDGHHDDHVDWALRQVQWLHANGRMFAARDHIHTLLYRHTSTATAAADDGAVPAELALDHPFGGLTATLVRPSSGVDAGQLASYVERTFAPELELGFTPIPLPPDAPVSQQGHDRLDGCLLNLSFTTAAPGTWWAEQRAAAARLRADGVGEMLWTAPFIPTIPGTDTYTDQLR